MFIEMLDKKQKPNVGKEVEKYIQSSSQIKKNIEQLGTY
jgi:hypothetical protein